MKIGNPADKPQPSAPITPLAPVSPRPDAATTTAGKTAARAAEPASEASAKVDLSSTAATLLATTTGAGADFDAEKVARIQQAIEDGSFRIDAGAIADKLIANAQEVLNRSGGN